MPGLHDGAVQIEIVRHDGGAQDSDRDVEHGRVGDDFAARNQPQTDRSERGPGQDQLHREAHPMVAISAMMNASR
jgi:hypothetical protein